MKREHFNSILRQMEIVREQSYEAETKAEERRFVAQYGRMWKAIEPYARGEKRFDDDPETKA